MNTLIKLEEVAMFALSIFLFSHLHFDWWWYPAFILTPDISMLGYLAGPKIGAYSYNLFHHKAIALIVLCFGILFTNELLLFSGIILFGHSSMDRIFGYGLKYTDSFHNTHLGRIGIN